MTPTDPRRPLPSGEIELPNLHSVQRSAAWTAALFVLGAIFVGGLSSPGISRAVGVTVEQGALVAGVFLACCSVATYVFYSRGGNSRLYRACDYAEGLVLSWGIAFLIQASSAEHSLFWIFHGLQVIATGLAGYSILYGITVCVGPLYLVALFAWRGDSASLWLSAMAGICGLFAYGALARLTSERDGALRREAALRQELARVSVARERARISRDLHDNVATELTALVWRVREISGAAPGPTSTLDMASVAERLRSVIDDLRSVVLALRGPARDFGELKLLIVERCRELCPDADVRVRVDGELEGQELAVFDEQILPMCFELVSNASRHAQARRVELTIRIDSSMVRVDATDDGRGLPPARWRDSRGGLASARQRAQSLGGSSMLERRDAGTHIALELPRPLRVKATERDNA